MLLDERRCNECRYVARFLFVPIDAICIENLRHLQRVGTHRALFRKCRFHSLHKYHVNVARLRW